MKGSKSSVTMTRKFEGAAVVMCKMGLAIWRCEENPRDSGERAFDWRMETKSPRNLLKRKMMMEQNKKNPKDCVSLGIYRKEETKELIIG